MPDLVINPPTATGAPEPEIELVSLTLSGIEIDRNLITAQILSAVGNHVIGGRILNALPGDYSATWEARNGVEPFATIAHLATVQGPLSRLAVHIDSDIDTVGERDDIAAMALWFADQANFNILGMTTSPPDSNIQEYLNCIAAYEQDRPALLAKGADPILFKTADILRSLVVAGTTADAPSRGYRLPGDSQYAGAHAAAQLLIANARDNGNPDSDDPTRKLWLIVQGGYCTLAQAAYEAVQLGELPDFFDRIRILGQPNWNSSRTINAWSYLFNNCWPAANNPGLFGNMWMLNGYLQWQGFNRDNGGSDTTFWNEVTANSFFGRHLRNTLTRPGGTFLTPHFRAGDAGAWFWLLYAKEQGNFNPANPNNPCGVYRTYIGELWAAQTFGYGPGSGQNINNPDPQGMTYSPTMFAPHLTVDSPADAQAALNLVEWYNRVRSYMALYQRQTAPSQITQISAVGTTVSWVLPHDGFSPITNHIISLGGEIVSDDAGAVTSFNFGTLPNGAYGVVITPVNAFGPGPASEPYLLTVNNTAPTGNIFRLEEGTGTSVSSSDGRTATLVNGPAWQSAPARVNFDGTNDRIEIPVTDTESGPTNFVMGIIARLSTISGARVLMSRNGPDALTQRQLQFRNNGGLLEFVAHPAITSNENPAVVIPSSAGAVIVNEWAMFIAQGLENTLNLRKNGVQIGTGSISILNRSAAMRGVPLIVGSRFNPSNGSYFDFLNGSVLAVTPMLATSDVEGIEAQLRAIAANKEIIIP